MITYDSLSQWRAFVFKWMLNNEYTCVTTPQYLIVRGGSDFIAFSYRFKTSHSTMSPLGVSPSSIHPSFDAHLFHYL